MNKLGETNSSEWEKIKGWLGAANGKKDHPLVQEAKRAQRVQKFDEGSGDVQPDDETMKFLQPQGAGMIAPSAARPPMPQAPLPPPIQPPPQVAPQAAPQVPVVQPPPQTVPQGPSSGNQVDNILGTNPEELKAFLQRANTPTATDRIGTGLSALADGLSRAGGGQSDYLEQHNKMDIARREAASGIPEKVAGLGKEKFGLTQTLDAQNPNSQYSKINQQTYGPDLVKMGLSPQQVAKMPAALIGDLLSKKITLEEAKARIEETGAYQRGMLANTAANNQAQIQQGAAKGLEGRGILQKVRDFIDTSPETATLQRQAAGGSGQSQIPDGRITVVSPSGKVGHIPQSQLKAAMAKGYKQQ